MTLRTRSLVALTAVVATLSGAIPARAETPHTEFHEANMFASGQGNLLFLAAGTLLPMVQHSADSRKNTTQVVDALVTSIAASEGLKLVFRERRPDSNQRDSFPSGHTTAAFAVAAVQSHYNPDESFLWYAGATVIGASRVSLKRHYVHDVLAGAALGYFIGRDSLSHHRVTFIPEYLPEQNAIGLGLHMHF